MFMQNEIGNKFHRILIWHVGFLNLGGIRLQNDPDCGVLLKHEPRLHKIGILYLTSTALSKQISLTGIYLRELI